MHEQRSIAESKPTTLPIETVGAEIKARIAAGDKAMDKAEQHYIAAGIQLAEVKARLAQTKEMRWSAFLSSHARVGRRRADDLIAIADGRITLAEHREKNRERVAAHRERKKSEQALRNAEPSTPDTSSPVDNPTEDLRAIIERQAKEIETLKRQLAKAQETIADKEAARHFNDARAREAEKQSEEVSHRLLFANAEKERLEKEVARLMDLLDVRTAPIPDNDLCFANAATVARVA